LVFVSGPEPYVNQFYQLQKVKIENKEFCHKYIRSKELNHIVWSYIVKGIEIIKHKKIPLGQAKEDFVIVFIFYNA